MSEKMVAFAAIPRPMESTTVSTKAGERERRRKVYARSFDKDSAVDSHPADQTLCFTD